MTNYKAGVTQMLIYHIVLPEVWAGFDTGIYRHASLADEGFIHCSYEHQLDGVIKRYYAGREGVIILTIETDRLMSRVVREASTDREIYPHIYGPINRDAIIGVERRKPADND